MIVFDSLSNFMSICVLLVFSNAGQDFFNTHVFVCTLTYIGYFSLNSWLLFWGIYLESIKDQANTIKVVDICRAASLWAYGYLWVYSFLNVGIVGIKKVCGYTHLKMWVFHKCGYFSVWVYLFDISVLESKTNLSVKIFWTLK